MGSGRAGELTRRGALGAMAAGAAGFVLLGPRGERRSSDGRVVLDYWEKWTGVEAAAMREIVWRFNQSQDRIRVRYLTMAGIDQKALIAIAGGDPPDLVGLWSYSIPVFAEAGAILALDDLATGSARVDLEMYAPAFRPIMRHPVWEGGSARWRTWGVINSGGTLGLYYNRSLMRAAGLDPDQPPRTIEELDAASERLTVVGADGRLERVGFMHGEPGWWTFVWGYHFGGSMWDAAGERSTVTDRAWVEAYRWMQGSIERHGAGRLQAFQDSFGGYDSPDNAFLSGKVAMICQGPWLSNVINAYRPDLDYGVAAFPVSSGVYEADRPVALIDSDVLVIPRGARHPEASFEFLCFTQRPENVEYLARAHNKSTPLARASAAFVEDHPNRGVAVHNALAQSPRGFRYPRTRVWTQLKAEFDGGATRIRRLEAPAEEVLATVQRRSQDVLDRQVLARGRRGGPGRGVVNAEESTG